ncbi:MAG: TonB-dependent receptor, partial [Endomicrobium sp.]|nr:TonB-dependent receptor [Endomicrobium sp.]
YTDKAAIFFAGSLYQTQGYRENSDFTGTNLLFNGSVNISDNSKIALSANTYNTDFGYPGSTEWLDPGRRRDLNRYFKADYIFSGEETNFTVSAYASNNTGYNDSTAGWDHSKWTASAYGAQADLTWKDFLFGAEFYGESFKNENTQDGGMSVDIVTVDKSRNNAGMYAQYDGVFGNLRVLPGVRYDNNSVFGGVFTPSLSAIFNFTKEFKISANAGKVWRAPSFNDLYSPWGANPDLKAEEGFSGDFGAEYAGKNYFASATGYFINGDNLIEFDPFFIPQNVDKARQYGAEVSAGYSPFGFLKGQVNYTLLKSENLTDGLKGNVLAFSPEHSVNFTLEVKPVRSLTVYASAGYKSEYYENALNTAKDNGFSTLDLGAAYKATDEISFWIKGFNIANAKYQIVNGYPMPGLTVYGGVDIKFWN